MSAGVTMKTIAAQAGVTPATVSLCLANHPRIPPATRERVQALARQLGYQPNPYLSALMRIRRQGRPLREKPVLGLVCAQATANGWREHTAPTIRQMREGAWEQAVRRGYRPQEFWLHRDGMTNQRFSEMLRARGVRALLLGPLAEGAPPPALAWEHFSAVNLSVPLPGLPLTTVCNDHYTASLRTVRECHQRGYRRPGLVLRRLHQLRFQGRWEAGFLVAGELLPGLRHVPPLYLENWDDTATLFRWLERARPDVIITPAADVILAPLTQAGWRVPEDIGLALLACPQPGDRASGIYQNGRLIGALAVDTLIGMAERHEFGLPSQATTLMVEGCWNEGQTLRTAVSAPAVAHP